jgi:drug/metabolite transporter (DMT)-like permease
MLYRGKDYTVGVFWSLTSAFLWATTFVSGRWLIGGDRIDPVTLSMLRFLIGAALLAAYGWRFRKKDLVSVSFKDLAAMFVLSLFGIVGMSVFLFFGQKTTTALNSSMILQTSPVIMCALGVFIGEKITGMRVFGFTAAIVGCAMALNILTESGLRFSSAHLEGDLLVLCSAACWAVYSVFSKPVVKRLGGFGATVWSMIFGALELVVMTVLTPRTGPAVPADAFSWLIVLYVAVFPTAVAFFAWFEAMDKIDFSLLNIMQYLTPVFTLALGWTLLGEKISLINFIGIALVIGGVIVSEMKAPPLASILRRRR